MPATSSTAARPSIVLYLSLLLLLPTLGTPTLGTASPAPDRGERPETLAPEAHAPTRLDGATSFFEIPAHIEPNRGQLPASMLYHADLAGYSASLYTDRLVLDPGIQQAWISPFTGTGDWLPRPPTGPLTLRFLGGDPTSTALQDETGAVSHHYNGSEPGGGVEDVPHARQVTYHEVWSGIDLVFQVTPEGNLEYTLELAAGADPTDAKLRLTGVDALDPQPDGSLLLHREQGTFVQSPPVAFPRDQPTHHVPVTPSVTDDATLTFEFPTGPQPAATVIDPVISYTSTYGGTEEENAWGGVVVDSDGNAYVSGMTDSVNFAEDTECYPLFCGNKQGQIHVSKFDPNGTLLWTTQFGGKLYDHSYAIALDPEERNVYAGGSDGWEQEAIIGKISHHGRFIRAHHLADTGRVHALTVDDDGQVYSAALPYDNAPSLSQGYLRTTQGNGDILLTRHTADLQTATPLTYYGGPEKDTPHALGIGPDGSLILSGTAGSGLPLSTPYQQYQGGESDGFVARFDRNGSDLLDATYLGGGDWDFLYDQAIDPQGNVYVAGTTLSLDFPSSPSAFQPSHDGPDTFVVKLSSDLSTLSYGTFLGVGRVAGPTYREASVAVTSSGAAHVAGTTDRPDFPSRNAVWTNPRDDQDLHAFAVLLSPSGDELIYATTLPKESDTIAYGDAIALGPSGAAHIVGQISAGSKGARPPGSTYYGPTATGGYYDGFISKLTCIDTDVVGTAVSDCPSGPTLYPLVAEDTFVQDSSVPVSPPPCEASNQGCTDAALGYADDPATGLGDATRFDINVSDFDGHNAVDCSQDPGCRFWLELNATVSGTVEAGIEGNSRTTAATLSVQSPSGSWHPLPDADIEVLLKTDGSGNAWIQIPDRLLFNGSSLPEIDRELTVRITPQTNEWDPQGKAWNVTVSAAQVQLVAPPVLIVHGWTKDHDRPPEAYGNGTPPSWEAQVETRFRSLGLARYGQDPWAWGPRDNPTTGEDEDAIRTFSYHNLKGFRRVAQSELRQNLTDLQTVSGHSGDVDIVSMSMGGLVSRWFAEDPRNQQGGASAPIGKLVTIGTPHLGSHRADAYVWAEDTKQAGGTDGSDRFYQGRDGRNVGRYIIDCPYKALPGWCIDILGEWRAWYEERVGAKRFDADDPRGWDMSVVADFELKANGNPVIDLLNQDPGAPGVPYYLIAGETTSSTNTIADDLLTWVAQPLLGDGVVSTESATLDGDPTFLHKVFSGAFHHGQLPEEPEIQTSAFDFLAGLDITQDEHDQAIYEKPTAPKSESRPWWLPPLVLLDGQGSASPMGAMSPASTSTSQDSSITVNVTFNVSSANSTLFETLAPNGTLADVPFRLIGPSGNWSSSDGNGTLANVTWNRSSGGGFLDKVLIHVPTPEDGRWVLEAVSQKNETVPMETSVYLDSLLRLEDRTDPSTLVGRPTVLNAAFLDGDTPVTGAQVNASVEEPLINRTLTVNLTDDGVGPDVQANDGVYTGQVLPLTPGNHPYVIRGVNNSTLRVAEGELATTLTPEVIEEGCMGWLVDLDPGSLVEEVRRLEGFVGCLEATATGVLPCEVPVSQAQSDLRRDVTAAKIATTIRLPVQPPGIGSC